MRPVSLEVSSQSKGTSGGKLCQAVRPAGRCGMAVLQLRIKPVATGTASITRPLPPAAKLGG